MVSWLTARRSWNDYFLFGSVLLLMTLMELRLGRTIKGKESFNNDPKYVSYKGQISLKILLKLRKNEYPG